VPRSADRGRPRRWCAAAAADRRLAEIRSAPERLCVYVRERAQVIDGVEERKNAAFLDERRPGPRGPEAVRANTVRSRRVSSGREAQAGAAPGVTLSIIKDDSSFIRESSDVTTTMLIASPDVLIVYLFSLLALDVITG